MKIQSFLYLITLLLSLNSFSQDSLFKAKALQDAGVLGNVKTGGSNGVKNEVVQEIDLMTSGEMGLFGIAVTKDSAFDLMDIGLHDSIFYETVAKKKGERNICTSVLKGIRLNKNEWNNLISSITDYKLSELIDLPPPSSNWMQDSSEGSEFSYIDIVTNRNKYACGLFDVNNPNEKLKKLMMLIQEIENRQ